MFKLLDRVAFTNWTLWSIFQVVAPGLLGNATQFRKQFSIPIEREHDVAATAELRRLTGPFLLRRTKADVLRSLKMPDTRNRIIGLGGEPVGNSPAQFSALLQDELVKWGKLVKEARIRID